MREIVGRNIRRIRKDKGLTILDLATAIQSDVGNISRLERGKQGFSDTILMSIAAALEIEWVELFLPEDFHLVRNLAARAEGEGQAPQHYSMKPTPPSSSDPISEHLDKVVPALRPAALEAVQGVLKGFISANKATANSGSGPGRQKKGGGGERKSRQKT
jgi:transcriptional regulator with XRE-family HTH domain